MMQKAVAEIPRESVAQQRGSMLRAVNAGIRALEQTKDPVEIRTIERRLESIEHLMRASGLFKPDEVREANEGKVWARWKLGQLLATVERKVGRPKKNGNPVTKFVQWATEALGLTKPVLIGTQRIATLPRPELKKALVKYHGTDDFVTYDELIKLARPYWYKASREAKHRKIRKAATDKLNELGPFPLIYADPPWRFQIYSAKGLERTPDQHYPTLTDEEIEAFEVVGKPIDEIAHDDAALLLWCTSSNVERALKIMRAWDFEFKSSAVWVKASQPDDDESLTRFGLGLVFRNMHEILLYGTRGNMPGPQYQPPSVFFYPRGRHSAKPPEIRKAIEKMYPDFDAKTRLELFAREEHEGWTNHGFEAEA